MIKIKELEPEYREATHSFLVGVCLEGGRYAFAIALSRGLGWPMVGLFHKDEIRLAAVSGPDGTLRDVVGLVNEAELGKQFGIYELRPITEEDLKTVEPIDEYLVQSILRKAQIVWPDLPWKPDISLRSKVDSFAKELEQLSRKHGFWIYGNFPTALPIITEEHGEEAGYELRPTMDGFSFFFNRFLGK